jgi:hypothetical protein
MLTVKDQSELEALLVANGIDISGWGIGHAKHLEDLWNEIAQGESRLQAAPLRRFVQVARVIIRQGDLVLVEAEQELIDGRRRKRLQPPSDKMKPGEDILIAAERCLQEELNLVDEALHVLVHTHRVADLTGDSPSYPGLVAVYTFHYVDAIVLGLPNSGFWVDNDGGESDPVKRHYWMWVPADSINIPEAPLDR